MSNPIHLAMLQGEARVDTVSDYVNANDGERTLIAEFERLVRHGYKTVDILVRVDGRDYTIEGDWLVRLFRKQYKEGKNG